MSQAPDPRRWRILGVLCLSLFVVMVDNTILNVAIPSLLKDLDATTSDVQWVIDAYSLVFAGLLITAGSLGDRYGRRRAMLIGFALFGAGSLLAAFAADPAQLVAMRALMGLGGALLMPGTLSIMAQVFGPDERAKAFAIWGATSMVGLAAGPTLGGFLLEHFWWGSAFLVNVPITAAAVIGLLVLVPESRGPRRRPDVLGAVLSTAGMSALVWAIISGPQHGWTGARTLGAAAAGAAALALFVLWQHRNPEPMLDLGLLRRRAFSGAATMIAMFGFALAGVMFALTQLLQLVLGYGPLKAGLALLPVAVSAGAGNGLGASLESRYGARPALVTGFAVLAAGLAALGLTDPHDGYAVLAAGLVVLGLGAGIGTPAAYSTLMAAVPPEEAGVSSAVNDAGQELGSALGVAVLGSVVSAVYAAGLPDGVPGPARDSLGAALATGDPGLARAAKDAFADAVSAGSLAAAGVMLAAAVFAAFVMRGVARPAAADVPEPVRT
ncbi:MFS transporter [Actinomadura madurae]|uniref:MFS transporter n=2 Tax=Actinomadura madurae TaxID=1993 RepID=UPI0020269B10|nr:MFS transporter [Actinomadura madurae]MCP9951672.1 MFS transporter [Actinomadura madurae]MCP9968446.1 MFS transporter [Actinomadura madurae]MCP9980916.1 MFS transporter [Actinomadura madurae]MCQ0017111.1 MFS transporter [Actinomadura madurae]URN08024.1 MFS transporter [Actinomadura madurae]